MCSPATQTRVSQSECRMVQNQTDDQLGGLQMVSHCSCDDTVKICAHSCDKCGWISWPCISVEYHHVQFLPAKQKPSGFSSFFFLSYINQSHLGYYFKSLKCPALIFIFIFWKCNFNHIHGVRSLLWNGCICAQCSLAFCSTPCPGWGIWARRAYLHV